MKRERRISMLRIGILLIVAMCAVSIAPAATAQETPFVIYGYVFNADGTEYNNPNVNITNMDTGVSWYAKNTSESNCYLLLLASGSDVNASETLRTEVTSPDGNWSKIVECAVSEDEMNIDGGRCNYNITLPVPNQQAWYFTNGSVTGPTGGGNTLWYGIACNHRICNVEVEQKRMNQEIEACLFSTMTKAVLFINQKK